MILKGKVAVYSIPDGTLLAGELPPNKHKLVIALIYQRIPLKHDGRLLAESELLHGLRQLSISARLHFFHAASMGEEYSLLEIALGRKKCRSEHRKHNRCYSMQTGANNRSC